MDHARFLRTLPSTLATTVVGALTVAVATVALTAGAHGPGGGHHGHAPAPGGASVADLTGPRDGTPDVRFVLTARNATVTLDSGETVPALTFDGTAPGPELRVRAGQLVEVVLRNADVTEGVTLHWHGLDVPNAEDGVAGVTQHAVRPGGEHVYRFRPDQVGTFWYHSHQDSARTVHRGLYGSLVVEPPAGPPPDVLDVALLAHTWPGPDPVAAIGTADTLARRPAPAGTRVRARLVNTDSTTQAWTVAGAPFTVVAIDGTDLHGPTPLDGHLLRIPAGGRYDVAFTVGAGAVVVGLHDGPATVFGDGAPPPSPADPPPFDPLSYGTSRPTDLAGAPDRELTQVLDTVRTVRRGVPGITWTINGGHHPPAAVVAEGDLVRVTIRNDGTDSHPMHLHGHHVLVLSRDGVPASGSPWWSDSLGVDPGQEYVVAFRADNPGVWMDHCHNLAHAAAGMVMHLGYAGVTTPFGGAGNIPE